MARRRSFRRWLLTSRIVTAVLSLAVALTGVVPIILLGENLDTDVGLFVRLVCVIGVGVWIFYSGAMADALLAFARARLSRTK